MKRRKANQKSVVTLYTTVQKFGVGKKNLIFKEINTFIWQRCVQF